MSDLPPDLQPIKRGQIEVAIDTTHSRERLASLPVRHADTPSPRSTLAIPECDDDEDGWVSMRLERVPADTTQGMQRASFISSEDGYYFNGVKQATFLHGRFSSPFDEEATKEIARGLDPELAKRVFDKRPRPPSAYPDSRSLSRDSKSCTPSKASKPESPTLDQPESPKDKAADDTFAKTPAAQGSSLDTGLDGSADFTSTQDPKRARASNHTFPALAHPPFEVIEMPTPVKSSKRHQRIEKIIVDSALFVQSHRGQVRPATNTMTSVKSSDAAPMFFATPLTTSLDRLKDFDEIERVDAERAMMWGAMRQYSNGEYLDYDRVAFRARCGSYDYLKKGEAWDLQVMKREMEEWVNAVEEDE